MTQLTAATDSTISIGCRFFPSSSNQLFFSLHSYSTSTRFSLIFNFNDQLNSKYICYVLVKSSRLHQMQASSILHIFNFIHLEPYVKLTILLCFVNITTVLIYSLQSFWILHIYCILCHPINFHFHITVHISLSLSQFLANSLHPSHSTRNTPSIWEQEAEVEGHFFLNFLGAVILAWKESQQIWLWPSQKWPLLDVCTLPKRIWGRWLLRATSRRSSCC